MPDVTPFELRRFGAALVLSLAALVSLSAVSHAAENEALPANAAEAPKAAEALKSGDAKADDATSEKPAKHDGAAHKKDAAAKGDGAKGDNAKAGDAKDTAPGLLTIREAKEEGDKEGRRNGTRSKAGDGTLIVWDKVNSVWVAPQPKNTYWVVDRFYQFNEGIWTTARTMAGPWEMTSQRFVPEAPRGRHIAPKGSVTAKLPSGIEAVYEPRIKVFKVAGHKGVFLNDGAFYRYDGGVWLESKTLDGPWAATSSAALPGPLRRAITPAEKGTKVTLPTGDVLVSEGEPNLFAVEGKPNVLYFDGTYYERRDGKWFLSAKSSEGWEEVSSQKIPGMVRSNYHKSGDDKAGKRKPGDKKAGDRKAGAKKPADKKQQGQKKEGAKAGAKTKTTESDGEGEPQ